MKRMVNKIKKEKKDSKQDEKNNRRQNNARQHEWRLDEGLTVEKIKRYMQQINGKYKIEK